MGGKLRLFKSKRVEPASQPMQTTAQKTRHIRKAVIAHSEQKMTTLSRADTLRDLLNVRATLCCSFESFFCFFPLQSRVWTCLSEC